MTWWCCSIYNPQVMNRFLIIVLLVQQQSNNHWKVTPWWWWGKNEWNGQYDDNPSPWRHKWDPSTIITHQRQPISLYKRMMRLMVMMAFIIFQHKNNREQTLVLVVVHHGNSSETKRAIFRPIPFPPALLPLLILTYSSNFFYKEGVYHVDGSPTREKGLLV